MPGYFNYVSPTEVQTLLVSLASKWPLADAISAEGEAIGRCVEAVPGILSVQKQSSDPLDEIRVTIEEAYILGLGTLALRAQAVAAAGRGFSNYYRSACSRLGLDRLHARIRRRSMYIPVIAGDEGASETLAARIFSDGRFPIVLATNDIKGLNLSGRPIDWMPFGGQP